MTEISCLYKEHTVIQNSKVNCPTMHTHHIGKHLSHSFTISYQSFGRGRATAKGVRVRGGGHGRGRERTVISDEIRAILVDNLVNEIILQ